MIKRCIALLILVTSLILSACSNNDPGPLAGTWKVEGIMPITTQFRSGETEAFGIIEKVSYKVKGNDVFVTCKDGIAKGMTMHYQMQDKNTVSTGMGIMRRVR